jgi:hypothetical protein
MNEGEGPTPGQAAGRRAKTTGNAMGAYGGGLAKTIAGIAVGGAAGKYGNTAAAGFGFAVGAYFGSKQDCACQ